MLRPTELPSAGEGTEEGDGEGDGEGADGKAGGRRRKAANADPSSTLAATWEELNAKKFDLAFAVDPLFHKTSAQFDEGGARGALVFPPCEWISETFEVAAHVLLHWKLSMSAHWQPLAQVRHDAVLQMESTGMVSERVCPPAWLDARWAGNARLALHAQGCCCTT